MKARSADDAVTSLAKVLFAFGFVGLVAFTYKVSVQRKKTMSSLLFVIAIIIIASI